MVESAFNIIVNFFYLGAWDYLLIATVTFQATALAYLYNPKWKAFLLVLPFPFTVASLAVGKPVNITNIVGTVLLLCFSHFVRLLAYKLRVPIIPAIIISALSYCACAIWLAKALPQNEQAYWIAVASTMLLALVMLKVFPDRSEPGHRTPLPVAIKLPLTAAVVFCIVLLKQYLQGFMTMFPMVTVVAAYEARHSLSTIARQMPILLLTMVPMISAIHLAQQHMHFEEALAIGWVVYLALLYPVLHFSGMSPFKAEEPVP